MSNAIQTNSNEQNSLPQEARRAERVLRPAVDVFENDGGYLVYADVPGASEDQLNLTLDQQQIHLEARATWGQEDRVYRRSFSLPSTVDAEKLDATLVAGVLSLTLPKRAEAKPRKIAVGTA